MESYNQPHHTSLYYCQSPDETGGVGGNFIWQLNNLLSTTKTPEWCKGCFFKDIQHIHIVSKQRRAHFSHGLVQMCDFINKMKFKFIVLLYCDNRFMFSSKTDNISHDLHVFPVYFLSIQYHKAYNLIQVQISVEYQKD